MRNREIIGVNQDRNRKWILLLAVICAIVMKIPLVLIYQGESGDLRDSRIEDVSNNTIYFAAIFTR